eukprot:m.191932 g.191932  ORF g.191932 m.191932 type:complete len:239 (-) comp24938_c1_seq1:2182-2898(-)
MACAARKVFVLGDSISIHWGPDLERLLTSQGWEYSRKSGVEEALRNLDDGGLGANGGDSSHCLEYMRTRVREGDGLRGAILLLNCGLHDLRTDPVTGAKQVTLDKYRDNLRELGSLSQTAAGAGEVVWLRITPVVDAVHNAHGQPWHRYSADVDEYNKVADGVMAELNVTVLDLHRATTALGMDNLYCDHVHYHEWVRKAQAAYIYQQIVGYDGIGALPSTVAPSPDVGAAAVGQPCP